jgi:hypothetical protein
MVRGYLGGRAGGRRVCGGGDRVGELLESRLSGAIEVMEGIGIFVAHWRVWTEVSC